MQSARWIPSGGHSAFVGQEIEAIPGCAAGFVRLRFISERESTEVCCHEQQHRIGLRETENRTLSLLPCTDG